VDNNNMQNSRSVTLEESSSLMVFRGLNDGSTLET
jgi:hypothetical protein